MSKRTSRRQKFYAIAKQMRWLTSNAVGEPIRYHGEYTIGQDHHWWYKFDYTLRDGRTYVIELHQVNGGKTVRTFRAWKKPAMSATYHATQEATPLVFS